MKVAARSYRVYYNPTKCASPRARAKRGRLILRPSILARKRQYLEHWSNATKRSLFSYQDWQLPFLNRSGNDLHDVPSAPAHPVKTRLILTRLIRTSMH